MLIELIVMTVGNIIIIITITIVGVIANINYDVNKDDVMIKQ